MDIKNKITVVTGAASGIGRVLCEAFAAEFRVDSLDEDLVSDVECEEDRGYDQGGDHRCPKCYPRCIRRSKDVHHQHATSEN